MNDFAGDGTSGNLRFRANTGGGSASSPTGGTSSDTSHSINSSAQHRCTIDGGVLLETEHVLLKVDPPLLACTARIRKDGRIYATDHPLQTGFQQYEISVPIEAIRLIVAALDDALLAHGTEHAPLRRVVNTWREILRQCSG
jgi:hypothetical protein